MALSSASGVAGHVTVQQRFAGLVEDAQVHGAGVEIDPTVKRVLLWCRIALRSPPCSLRGFSRSQHTTAVC